MMNTWIYMEAIDSMPDVEIVHCDTRDFHIFLNDMNHTALLLPLTDILDSIEDGSIVTTNNNYILGNLSVSDLNDIGATTEAANNPRADEATVDQTQLDA